jgi:hypothetical protein
MSAGNHGFGGFSPAGVIDRSIIPNVDSYAESFKPSDIPGLGLWYDIHDDNVPGNINTQSVSQTISTLTDKSGAGRTGTCSGVSRYKDKETLYSGWIIVGNGYVTFSSINVGSLIVCGWHYGGAAFVISDSDNYNFHATDSILNSTYAATSAKNGEWRVNGIKADPLVVADGIYFRSLPFIVSCVPADTSLSQNRFGYDRSYNANDWIHYEVLVYTTRLARAHVQMVEQYLANKWRIWGYSSQA